MAHDLEILADGQASMFYTKRELPWHGLGTAVDDCLTAHDALVLAHLDWNVQLFPMYAQVDRDGQYHDIPVPEQFAVVRDRDNSILGTVGSKYNPYQNTQCFSFFDAVVADGSAKYETAGSLKEGRQIFMTAKVPREILIGGQDAVDLYLMLASSHDGSLALTAAITPVRVVCANTLNMALRGTNQQWKIRHTDALDGRVAEAREALGMTFAYADEFETEMNRLVEAEFTKAQFERMVKAVAPARASDARPFSDEQYAMIGLFESSPTLEGVRYTEWGALNAVREYEDWGRTYRTSKTKTEAEQRTEATWFGRNVVRTNNALAYLTAN